MATPTHSDSNTPGPDDLFDRPATNPQGESNSRRLLSEVLAETGREAQHEEQAARSELARYREACHRRQVAADVERKEAVQESFRRELRRQRRAATMRTRELAALLGEPNQTISAVTRPSGEFYATAIAPKVVPERRGARPARTKGPWVLGSLAAVLLATLLIPSVVSGSTPMLGAPLAKQSVQMAQPASSNLQAVGVVLVAETDSVATSETSESEDRSSSRRDRRRSRQNSEVRTEHPDGVAGHQSERTVLEDISLDGSDIFSRGSE